MRGGCCSWQLAHDRDRPDLRFTHCLHGQLGELDKRPAQAPDLLLTQVTDRSPDPRVARRQACEGLRVADDTQRSIGHVPLVCIVKHLQRERLGIHRNLERQLAVAC